MDASREVTGIRGMELPVKGSDSDKDMLVSDIFLNVPVKGGEDWSVACLTEQQHKNDEGFAGRVFGSWVQLRASRPTGRVTGFVIYSGDSKGVNFYTETCYGMEATLKFRIFHVPSYSVPELREDRRPFARVMYAGRLSLESGDDLALREKYAWELLNTTGEEDYDNRQRKFIFEFVGRIFRLSDPKISEGLKEAFKVKTVPLSKYAEEIAKEEGVIEGMEKGKFEVARSMLARRMSVSDIVDITGLNERDVLSLR
jgi:hypothetical protein